jgi:trk system potassium uptake protein TrkH
VAFGSVAWVVGLVLALVGAALLAPLATALLLGEPALPFAIATAATLALAGALLGIFRGAERALDHREGFLTVTLCWLGACVASGVPYILHPALEMTVIDGFFESTSGYTTTGATVISGLGAAPKSVLLWRALTHWIGGMGMVLLGVAVLPLLGVGGMQLFRAEGRSEKLTPRIAETARVLWVVYVGVSAVNALLLWAGGMSAFDAICHAMSTLATGGFSTQDSSMAHFDSAYLDGVTTFFMLVGGTNFALLHRALTGSPGWTNDPELRAYLGVFALATLVIALDLRLARPEEFAAGGDALRHASFSTATVLSTTGLVTRDFDSWPEVSRVTLFALLFCGGMTGSTTGGVKLIRYVILARVAMSRFTTLLHPRAVDTVKLGGRAIPPEVIRSTLGFVGLYYLVFALSTLVLCGYGHDLVTSFSASAASLANIGPGLGGAGPAHTFDFFEPGAKLMLALLMILGRLEIYTVLVLLTPVYWRG